MKSRKMKRGGRRTRRRVHKKKRRTRRRKSYKRNHKSRVKRVRRRTRRRRRRMRGGNKLNQSPFPPKGDYYPLNKKVVDTPQPTNQAGGGLLDYIPGFSDIRDMYRDGVSGVYNTYNQAKGARPNKSPRPDKDQYVRFKPVSPLVKSTTGRIEELDLGNISLGAEQQAARYKI